MAPAVSDTFSAVFCASFANYMILYEGGKRLPAVTTMAYQGYSPEIQSRAIFLFIKKSKTLTFLYYIHSTDHIKGVKYISKLTSLPIACPFLATSVSDASL
jgi:hypothetical protein